ncbi:MAG: DUF6166 domain-containing protein [Bacteroidota bacterium]
MPYGLTQPEHVFVCEQASGYALDEADRYARRLAGEAEDWLVFARERSRMNSDTLVSKALSSLAFTLQHRAHSLAIPSKLVGVSKHQRTLWDLVRAKRPFGTELSLEETGGKLLVSLGEQPLGAVQGKHLAWLRPLIPFGARVFLVCVTGHEREGYRLGVNIAFGYVGTSVAALRRALGQHQSGDGYSGHEATVTPQATVKKTEAPSPITVNGLNGGSAGGPDEAIDPDDIILWRDERSIARLRKRQGDLVHIVRHSPTGPEWGYCGSGPADAAYSILLAFCDEATASHCYQLFKAEVIAAVPLQGGVIRARTVRDWLACQA